MQSRRDQVQAHLFTMGRFTAAMLREDFTGTDDPSLPAAEILQLEELVTGLNEGKYHVGPGSVVRLLLRRDQ